MDVPEGDHLSPSAEHTLTSSGRDVVFRLPAKRTAASLARERTRHVLQRWAIDGELRDNVLLVASELTANAVEHGTSDGGNVLVAMTLGATLRVEVTDGDFLRKPALSVPGMHADRGRGLLLTDALTTAWGVTLYPPLGKVVWADFALPESTGRIP